MAEPTFSPGSRDDSDDSLEGVGGGLFLVGIGGNFFGGFFGVSMVTTTSLSVVMSLTALMASASILISFRRSSSS